MKRIKYSLYLVSDNFNFALVSGTEDVVSVGYPKAISYYIFTGFVEDEITWEKIEEEEFRLFSEDKNLRRPSQNFFSSLEEIGEWIKEKQKEKKE